MQTGGSTLWTIRNLASGSGGNTLQFRNTAGVTKLELAQGATSTLNGNFSVLGSFSATTKSFKIDHPLDPEHKFLMHTCVESDQMANLYSGNATTDNQGHATITLPAWFEALNTDFRYQLTVLDDSTDDFILAKVARKIDRGTFEIKTSKGNVEVSWLVVGIRHDPFAKLHRTPVEVDKAPDEQGRYIAPDAYGKPASLGLLNRPEAAPTLPTVPAAPAIDPDAR